MLQYIIIFNWGLLAILAFIGWGRIVNWLALRPADDDLDWGLSAGWGMALALFIGGCAALIGVANKVFVISFVLAGIGLFLGICLKPWMRRHFPADFYRRPQNLIIGILIAFLIIYYATWVFSYFRNCNDDDIAYFTFVFRLLETGTLIEPFSLRRMVSYGGQSFLQSLIVAVGDENNAMLLDRGIAVIINFGLVAGFFRRRRAVHYAFAFIMTVILPFPTLNSASHFTGLTIFLTLSRTLQLIPDPAEAGLRRLCLIAAIIAGAASLRIHFAFVAAVVVIVYWFLCYLRRRGQKRLYFISFAQTGLASAAFLAPWMALSYVSSGTALYPLFDGNQRPAHDMFNAPISAAQHLGFYIDFLTGPEMVFFIPLLLVSRWQKHLPAMALYAGASVGCLALLQFFSYTDISSIGRYVHPFVAAAFISSLAALFSDIHDKFFSLNEPDQKRFHAGDLLLICASLALISFTGYKDFMRVRTYWGLEIMPPERRFAYLAMQEMIPKEAKFLAMLDQPFVLNYARNVVLNVDFPGAASPDPGMPFFKGQEALKSYLLSQSIRYVAHKDFEKTVGCRDNIYSRAVEKLHLNGPNHLLRMQAAYYLDIMDNLKALAASGRVLYDANGLTAFEIR